MNMMFLLVLFYFYLFSEARFEDHKPVSKNEIADLQKFFSTTYIEKVKANKDNAANYCFKEGWLLFHFHHVCTRGGQDGLVVGLLDVPNDWVQTGVEVDPSKEYYYSAQDWDKLIAGNYKYSADSFLDDFLFDLQKIQINILNNELTNSPFLIPITHPYF